MTSRERRAGFQPGSASKLQRGFNSPPTSGARGIIIPIRVKVTHSSCKPATSQRQEIPPERREEAKSANDKPTASPKLYCKPLWSQLRAGEGKMPKPIILSKPSAGRDAAVRWGG